MRYLFTLILTIFVLGCIPYSQHPLTAPDKEELDSSILGTWFWKEENEAGYIHIGLDEESRLLRLLMVDYDRNGELEVSEFSGFSSAVSTNNYLNLKWVRPVLDEDLGYIFVKYEVISDSLCIAIMDRGAAESAINEGTLKGEVKKNKRSTSIYITEAQKELQQFIIANDLDLFSELKCVQKLKLPNKRLTQTQNRDEVHTKR